MYRESLLKNDRTYEDSSHVEETKPRRNQLHNDVNEVLFADHKIMNFSHFLPGKAHGLNLLIGNKLESEQIIELSIDQTNYTYSKREIMHYYPETKTVTSDSSDYNTK